MHDCMEQIEEHDETRIAFGSRRPQKELLNEVFLRVSTNVLSFCGNTLSWLILPVYRPLNFIAS